MSPGPSLSSGALLRLRTRRPTGAFSFCIGSRLSLSHSSINRVKTTKDSPQSPDEAGSNMSSSADPVQSDAPTFLESQTLNLDGLRNRLKERASIISASATLSLAEIGERLNKVTGYEHIEVLKRKVVETEAAISAKRQASRDAKLEYEKAVGRRSKSQREVNDLLQRKSSWVDVDVSRFTALVREDHLYEQEETRAKAHVAELEAEVEKEFNELMRVILNRYHEEQVWSDKIRSASTYGSLMALGVNIVVFFLAIVVVEPWKRRRLAQTFEKRIEELSLENRGLIGQGMSNLAEHFEKQEQVFGELVGIFSREDRVDAVRTHLADAEARPAPSLSMAQAAKTARDRDLLIAGAVGLLGGSLLTFLVGSFR